MSRAPIVVLTLTIKQKHRKSNIRRKNTEKATYVEKTPEKATYVEKAKNFFN